MTRSRIIQKSGGRKSRRLMYRQMTRIHRRLLSAAFLLGCCCGGTFYAQAGVKETFGPYQDTLWIALYINIGFFVFTLIYEIVASRMVREAEREDLEAVQKSIAEAEKKDVGSGLIADSADPFQALLNQASSPAAEMRKEPAVNINKEPAAKSVPEPKAETQPASAISKPTSKLQPFNGAATLPVSVALVGGKITRDPLATPSPDESNNPFRRAIKPNAEESKLTSKLDVPAAKSMDAVVSAKPLELAPVPAPSSAPAPVSSGSEAAAAVPAKPVAEAAPLKAEKPALPAAPAPGTPAPSGGTANAAAPFSGSATVAVKPAGSVAASIAMVTGKPGIPAAAPQAGAPGAKPFNVANMPKPGAPFAPPRVPVPPKPVVPPPSAAAKTSPASGSGEDPWKKLLGQTGSRAGTPQSSGPIKSPASPGIPGSAPKGGSNPTRSLSGTAGSSVPGTSRSSVSGGSDDPWKALLGNSGKGMGNKANPTAPPSAGQSPGISLGIKKNDDVNSGK